MHIRTPIVLAVVAAAGGVALVRALHPAAPASFTVSREPVRAVPAAADRGASQTKPSIVVYVAGAVAHAGVYRVATSSRAADALGRAGGATAAADLTAVNLAAPLADGDEVIVPKIGDDPVPAAARHRARKHKHKRKHRRASNADTADASAGSGAPPSSVDINHADESALEALPGIGPALAQRIVDFRAANGPFAASDDLLDVNGMTERRLADISAYVTVR